MLKILFVSSEVQPLIKTGGLADVSASLSRALAELGHDVRILMPGYFEALRSAGSPRPITAWTDPLGGTAITLRMVHLSDSNVPIWLLDAPGFNDRPGNPYLGADGEPYPDNAVRFDLFARATAAIAGNKVGLAWQPDVIHCNDWQTGLVPVRMLMHRIPGAILYTIHNLGYQGLFPSATLSNLKLPGWLWHLDALEFYGLLSFMKGGVVFSDRLTTVSPTYAREICTPEHGGGLEGLFNTRIADLAGILNGIDTRAWDPEVDPHLAVPYSIWDLGGKAANKARLQAELGLEVDPDKPLVGFIARLAEQKGVDLLLGAAPALLANYGIQLAILGNGQRSYELALHRLQELHPGQVAVHIGFDEGLAHRIEAGADIFLMPSRFEPCGLNQLYSMRYGTVPVVRAVGGLVDSVINATLETVEMGQATGVTFTEDTSAALVESVRRALDLYADRTSWRRIQTAGMQQDLSWKRSATEYVSQYERALAQRRLT